MTDTKVKIELASLAFSQQDYEKALELLLPLVEAGDAAAIGMLGLAYQTGSGVEPDGIKAVELLQKAVELGDAYAAHNLARLYMQGAAGVKTDAQLSNVYYNLAKEMGLKYESEENN